MFHDKLIVRDALPAVIVVVLVVVHVVLSVAVVVVIVAWCVWPLELAMIALVALLLLFRRTFCDDVVVVVSHVYEFCVQIIMLKNNNTKHKHNGRAEHKIRKMKKKNIFFNIENLHLFFLIYFVRISQCFFLWG